MTAKQICFHHNGQIACARLTL